MQAISVFSSRKVNPFPANPEPEKLKLPEPVHKEPPKVVERISTRTMTSRPIKPRWSIPLQEQGSLPYSPDELEELYAQRDEEVRANSIAYEGDSDRELIQAILEEPTTYERCDSCDCLIEIEDSKCPKCGWQF